MSQSMNLTDLQKDALKEVGNIGAGHAATALSQLLNAKINLSEPRIDVIKFRDLASRVGHENRTVAALHMYVRGEAPGQMVVLFDREQALDFVSQFLHRVIGDIQIFDSIADSTLKELGNIIAGSYLTAIIQLTGSNLLPSVPTLSYGTVQAAFRTLMSILPGPRRLSHRVELPRQGKRSRRSVHPDTGDRVARPITVRLRRGVTAGV